MTFLHTLVAFAVALGVLIVFHELGHYLAARACGVKVLRFSVGFGKPLLIARRGPDQTEWVLAAFPLGGYVKMLDEREGEVAPAELPRAFNRQSVQRRFVIVAAGPAANFLLAILLYWAVFVAGIPGLKPVLGPVPAGTPAAVAGFIAGETVTEVGGEKIITWQDVRWALLDSAVSRKPVDIQVRSPGGAIAVRRLDLSGIAADDLDGDFLGKLGLASVRPDPPAVVGRVIPDKPAAMAGFEPDDRIVAVDGREIRGWSDLVQAVSASPGRRIEVKILRGSREMRIQVVPEASEENGRTAGRIGIAPRADPDGWREMLVTARYSPATALGKALGKTWDTSILTLRMLGKMVLGEVSWRNVSGPITIADYAGQSAQMGWGSYVSFLALVSVSLGILNLLPIPVLDGGHLMYYMVELGKGSPVSEKAMEIGQQIGMALLIVLMAFALFNDVNRLLTG